MPTKHLVIPDTQAKPGVPLEHFSWLGEDIVAKKPDTIIHIGDFVDMPSLSSYDEGKKVYEGRRYKKDIEAGHKAMELLMAPLYREQKEARKRHKKPYDPRRIVTLGNHEDRISRAIEDDASRLDGVISLDDLPYRKHKWEVFPFLEPVVVDGVAYCHYFTSGVLGRPVTSASALVNKKHMSCVMGHVQGRQIAYAQRADGKHITGIFSGCFYQHDEDYLHWQGNQHWRGIWMLHEVVDGSFDEMPVSLNYLKRKYG